MLGLACEKLFMYEESVKAYDMMMQYDMPQILEENDEDD
jgi:hypothetical protein